MHSKQIKFLGGEPLLNRSICDFLVVARRSQMFDRIRVTTNGLLLSRMSDEFWKNVDILEISYYKNVNDPLTVRDFSLFREKSTQFGVQLEIVENPKFAFMISDTPIPDPNLVHMIYSNCSEPHGRTPCHTIYHGRLYRCSRVHTLDRYLSEIAVVHKNFSTLDGLPVDSKLTVQHLRDYLESGEPLKACGFCFGDFGRYERQRQWTIEEVSSRRAGKSRTLFDVTMLSARVRLPEPKESRRLSSHPRRILLKAIDWIENIRARLVQRGLIYASVL